MQVINTLGNAQFALIKQRLWSFPAVINNLFGFFQHVNMVGSERENGYIGHEIMRFTVLFNRMEDACRVIHHAIRIDYGRKLLILELVSNAFCKARTNE